MTVSKLPSSVDELFVWMDPLLTTQAMSSKERASLKTRIEAVQLGSDDLGSLINIVCVGEETASCVQAILPNKVDGYRVIVSIVPKLTTEEVVQSIAGEDNVIR